MQYAAPKLASFFIPKSKQKKFYLDAHLDGGLLPFCNHVFLNKIIM